MSSFVLEPSFDDDQNRYTLNGLDLLLSADDFSVKNCIAISPLVRPLLTMPDGNNLIDLAFNLPSFGIGDAPAVMWDNGKYARVNVASPYGDYYTLEDFSIDYSSSDNPYNALATAILSELREHCGFDSPMFHVEFHEADYDDEDYDDEDYDEEETGVSILAEPAFNITGRTPHRAPADFEIEKVDHYTAFHRYLPQPHEILYQMLSLSYILGNPSIIDNFTADPAGCMDLHGSGLAGNFEDSFYAVQKFEDEPPQDQETPGEYLDYLVHLMGTDKFKVAYEAIYTADYSD